MELVKGKAYFSVFFSKPSMELPEIETFIFIGKNIFGESEEYFFQSPSSYQRFGDFTEIKDSKIKARAEIHSLEPEIVETMYSLSELIEYLGDCLTSHPQLFGEINGRPS